MCHVLNMLGLNIHNFHKYDKALIMHRDAIIE